MLSILSALIAALAAALIGAFADPIGRALGLLDVPDVAGGRKLHTRVTPLVGGFAVVIACVVAVLAILATGPAYPIERELACLGAGVVSLFLIGAVDDRANLTPTLRLVLTSAVLLITIVAVPEFTLGELRFTGWGTLGIGGLGVLFALLCLVGLINAVNMADGKNGIVIGLGLIWSAILFWRLPPETMPLLAAVATALGVLFFFNMRNRLFLGDGGGYAISAIFGLLAIAAYNRSGGATRADDVALMFALPVLDTLRLMVSRRLQGRSIFDGGRDHLHHYLYASIGWPRGLVVYALLVAAPNAAALVWPGTAWLWLAVTGTAYALVLHRASAVADRALAGPPLRPLVVPAAVERAPVALRVVPLPVEPRAVDGAAREAQALAARRAANSRH